MSIVVYSSVWVTSYFLFVLWMCGSEISQTPRDFGSCLSGSPYLDFLLTLQKLGCSEAFSFKVRKMRNASIAILASFLATQVWLSNHGWLCPLKIYYLLFHKYTFSSFAFFINWLCFKLIIFTGWVVISVICSRRKYRGWFLFCFEKGLQIFSGLR